MNEPNLEPDVDPEYYCSACDEHKSNYNRAKEMLEGIVSQSYGNFYEEGYFEWMLEELAHSLGVRIPEGKLKLKKK